MVEIAKALSQDVRVLILDEPTAALSLAESDALFEILRGLTAEGIGILYVSHRLREVLEISDTVTVLKDGRLVDTVPAASLDIDRMVAMMVGRELGSYFPPRREEPADDADTVVRVVDGSNVLLSRIQLELRRGEVLGVAGLAGSGRTELVQALFGVEPFTSGDVFVDGDRVTIDSPRAAIAIGMGYISEDRKSEGLLLGKGSRDNGLLPARAMGSRKLEARLGAGVDIDDRLEETFESVELRAAVASNPVRFLSGGNQQKVVVAKWLATDSRIVVFDEPTRGIDVGARAGIHDLIRGLAEQGAAVLMVSSELPEVIGMSDRIVVMHEGTIGGVLPGGASETEIMSLAVGDSKALLTVEDVSQSEGVAS
jgi:ribose transport system ATP-binding protein